MGILTFIQDNSFLIGTVFSGIVWLVRLEFKVKEVGNKIRSVDKQVSILTSSIVDNSKTMGAMATDIAEIKTNIRWLIDGHNKNN